MSKFMSKSSSNNDEIINMQREEAAKNERNEYDRQERLRAGRERINAMFSEAGGNYTDALQHYWRDTPTGDPLLISPLDQGQSDGKIHYGALFGSDYGSRTPSYSIVNNPNYRAAGWDMTGGDVQRQEGIGSGFYDKFRQSIYDHYQPEIARQHEEAKDANLFDLARRGLLRSSTATKNAAELVRERADADARLAANAENQTAGLQGDISRAQQSAMQLLEQSADPTSAANAAATEVNAIQSRSPQFDPLGDLFSAAARSFAGWQNAQNQRRNYGSIPTRNPYTDSGRNVG